MIRQKVMTKNREQLWSELDHLFVRKPFIDKHDFRRHILHLGVELSNEAASVLFQKFDKDKSGTIDAYEYASALLLDLPAASRHQYEQRQKQMNKEKKKEYKLQGDPQISS